LRGLRRWLRHGHGGTHRIRVDGFVGGVRGLGGRPQSEPETDRRRDGDSDDDRPARAVQSDANLDH